MFSNGFLIAFLKGQSSSVRSAQQALASSKRLDSRVRAKNKASERAGEKRGETGEEVVLFPSLPSFFPALSPALIFPLSERLEQAKQA